MRRQKQRESRNGRAKAAQNGTGRSVKQGTAKAAKQGSSGSAGAFLESARGAADRLYRAAAECARQRERYSRLVAAAVHEAEQQAALRVACLCDELLIDSAHAYERTLTAEASHRDEDWYQRANALWHACREYQRRHRRCDESSRQLLPRKPQKFTELAMEYDLEASALLALRLAVAAYRKACPDCELEDRPQTYVA